MHRRVIHPTVARAAASLAALGLLVTELSGQDGFRFRSGVELINVTATVTDRSGRFVPGLQQSDFAVYDDDQLVDISHFSAERVPVSLGIALDTSGSMAGDRISNAREAVHRFLDQLQHPDDEVFLLGFSNEIEIIHDWTMSHDAVSAQLRRVRAVGGTALYDAMLKAVPMAHEGHNAKKAVILISDGNDTDSTGGPEDVRQAIQESEVLVYAVGVDDGGESSTRTRPRTFPPVPTPPSIPGRGRPRWPVRPQLGPAIGNSTSDRLNVAALRDITDPSGGRTEIVRRARDLDRATAAIADELSKQYHLGYVSPGQRDGRWHTIRVEVRDRSLLVRARRGYTAAS